MTETINIGGEIAELQGYKSVIISDVLPPPPNPDNTGCSQACAMAVLNYFIPNHGLSFTDICRFSGKEDGKFGFTPSISLLFADGFGLSSVFIDAFDLHDFAARPQTYLADFQSNASPGEVAKNPSTHRMVDDTIACIDSDRILIETRMPTLVDIHQLLSEGYLILCSVNSRELHECDDAKTRSISHAVLIYGINPEEGLIYLHDPGAVNDKASEQNLEAKSNWAVPIELFLEAWGDEHMRGIYAFGLKNEKVGEV